MKLLLNKIWPIIVIFLLWAAFASPYLLKNKVPFPSTYLVANFGPWNTYAEYGGPVKNGATPDVISQIFPWKKLVIDSWKKGDVPLWNPYVFSGTPLLANYQSAALSPFNLIFFILPFIDAWSLVILLQPLLAGIFMYLFARSIKLSQAASLISSIAFMFCGFITTWGAYGLLGYAILFLPLALFAIEKFYEKKKWYYSVLLSLVIPLSFFSGHFQTSLYFLIFVIAYCSFKLIQTKRLNLFITNIISILFGILLCAPQLLPSIEFYQESVRSAIFQKTEVIPWNYIPTFISPDFFGNPVTGNNWFGHYAEWNAYIGLIPLLLAIYSWRRRNLYIAFFTICLIVALLLAFDSPLLTLLIALKVPVLSTSAAGRVIVLFSFSAAILAGFGSDNAIRDLKNRNFKSITLLLASFGLIFLLLWGILFFQLFIDTDKVSISVSNLRLPTIFFVLFAAGIVTVKFVKNKKIIVGLSLLIILLVGVDLVRFSTKWYPFESRDYVYPQIPITKELNKISGYNREFGNFDQEASEIYNLPNLEGYDPLYIQRYGEFIEAGKDGLYHIPQRSVVSLSKNGEYTGKIINFLGVKFIIHKIADGQNIWAFPYWDYPVDQFRQIYKDDKYEILINDKVLPRAFVVGNTEVITKKRKIIKEIFKNDLNLNKTAIIEEDSGISTNATGSAIINNYKPSQINISVNSSGRALLILTDPYYPGWNAYVNGKREKLLRSNYAFRGVVVPGGKSTVIFKYEPDSFKNGLILASIGFFGIVFLSIYLAINDKSK